MSHLSDERKEALIESGDITRCAACGELSSLDWTLVDNQPDQKPGSTIVVRQGWASGQVAMTGMASGLGEWECGHCGAHNVEHDSPLLAECYTHYPPEDEYDPDFYEDEMKAARKGH